MKMIIRLSAALMAAVALNACMMDDDFARAPAVAGMERATFATVTLSTENEWDRLAGLPWPQGGQTKYQTYDDARRIFWRKLYPAGGEDLYCGAAFDGARKSETLEPLSVEHVVPADVIAETEPGCTNRECAATRVQRAMADLQNLWPALQKVNASRQRLRFGKLPDDTEPRFPEVCPAYKRGQGRTAVVEPRDDVKGDVARSIVYMHFVYGLPLENAVNDKELLIDWMRLDPPDQEEMRRNVLIGELQGTPNPLLDLAFVGM